MESFLRNTESLCPSLDSWSFLEHPVAEHPPQKQEVKAEVKAEPIAPLQSKASQPRNIYLKPTAKVMMGPQPSTFKGDRAWQREGDAMHHRTAEYRRGCKMVVSEQFEGDWGNREETCQGRAKFP